MVVSAALAALTLTGRIEVWHVLALSVISGIAGAMDMPARQSLIPHLVARDDLMNAIALNSAGFNGSRILGPAVAGLIIQQLGGRSGAGWSFALNTVSYLAVIGALATLRVDSRPANGERQPVLSEVREGVAFAWQHPALRMLLVLLAVVGIFGLSFHVLLPVFARDVLHVSAGGYGMLLTANGIGATLGALVLATAWPARPVAFILGSLGGFAVLLAAFAGSIVFGLSLALMVGVGGTMIAYLSATNTMIQSIVPDALRGRVMSLYILAFFGVAPLGGLLMGSLASAFGAQAAVFVGAVVCAVGALALRVVGREVVRGPALSAESQSQRTLW
jgi:MFS family permease